MLLSGIFPPITTPFYPDGNVYYKKLEANVERYSRTPVAGLVVLGSTGEAILLSDDERHQVLKTARAVTANHKVLIAGTGNMLAFYRFVADRSPLPVIIYNFPQATGYDMPAELVIELADHPNIIGIKESSGDVEKARKIVDGTRHVKRSATVTETFDAVTARMLKAASEGSGPGGELVPVAALAGPAKPSSAGVSIVGALKTRQKEVGFQVLVGAAHKLESSLQAGADGAILAFAVAAPTACYEIYAAWKEGDFELARLKQERIAKAAERVVGGLSIPGAKYAMDLNGYFGGPVRLPLLPLTADLKTEVEQLLTDIRN